MAKYLFIVESPGKCAKIRSYLGKDYEVLASIGHVREIPKKGMNIDIKAGFIPTYEISHDKKEVVRGIKEAAKKSERIYLASDPDREGSAIAYSIYELLDEKNKKKCLRIKFNEINKSSLEKAIKEAKDMDTELNLVAAAKARQVLDRLIGYKISPILWTSVCSGTSAGRVQSIALKLVCEREKEIKAFKPTDFWFLEALMGCKKGEFWAKVCTKDKDGRYLDEKVATDDFEKLKKASYVLDKVEKGERVVNPNPPFDTASLLTTCGTLFSWSTKKTASLSQGLYETGKITYLRTDSFAISDEAMKEVREYIPKTISKEYLSTKPNVYFKKAKSASQGAHECIRPTHLDDAGTDIDDSDAKRLYQLIRARFIASQMKPMIVDAVTYYIKASTKHDLIAKGQSIKFDGWYKVYNYNTAKEEILPDAEEKENLPLKDIKKTKHTTIPPSRYNEASLVKKMESEGVGRPSTYASTMESLKKRTYVTLAAGKKNALEATELGMRVFDYLQPNFKDFIMDIGFTASVEGDLDKIEDGEKTYLETVQAVYDVMQAEIKKAAGVAKKDVTTGEKCLVCETGSIVKRHGKFGDFWSCDKYSKDSDGCKAVYEKDKDGKFKIKEKKSSGEDTKAICPVCKKGNIFLKTGKFGEFFACGNYPVCVSIFEKDEDGKFKLKKGKSSGKDTGASCLVCHKGTIVSRKGQYGEWFSCNQYPRCRTTFTKSEDGSFQVKDKKTWSKKSSGDKEENEE